MSEPVKLNTDSQEATAMRARLLGLVDEMNRLQRRGLRVNFAISSSNGFPALTAFEVVKVVEL